MERIKFWFLWIVLTLLSLEGVTQYGGDYEYTREFVWGITKASNSGLVGGLMFKKTVGLKPDVFHGGSIELVNIKHPQEQKRLYSVKPFILGKANYLYSIRFSYSREFILFRKAPQQGVQINLIGMIGPTIGLESPYYVEISERNGQTKNVPYETVKDYDINYIIGPGNPFQGLFESSVVPGLNTKVALAFEFGTFRSNVAGIETGFQADFYSREIILIPTANNSSIYPSAYFTLYYGSRK